MDSEQQTISHIKNSSPTNTRFYGPVPNQYQVVKIDRLAKYTDFL